MAGVAHVDEDSGALFADLYELTMAQAYFLHSMTGTAVFECSLRKIPRQRLYTIAAGLDAVLEYLENYHFTPQQLDYLQKLGLFEDRFLSYLADLRFGGDVWAVPEGTFVFEHEPILQICAPILEAQLVETFVLNQVHLQTVVASKAARVVEAAEGRAVVDFGSRRAHGLDAALKVARASYIAGVAGTSNLVAGQRFGIPVFGTMAHSYIEAVGDEMEAWRRFARLYPETTLLIDTYDTLSGVDRVIALAREMGDSFRVKAVRLDSGNLLRLAKQARERLDAADLSRVEIFVSSDLDEYRMADLLAHGAPIDGFGVGTRMAVSADAPELDMAYKIVEYDGKACTKLSPEKRVYPGRKQVYRIIESGRMVRDLVAGADEQVAGEPLLVPVMRKGRRLPGYSASVEASVEAARLLVKRQHALLKPDFRSIGPAVHAHYEVRISEKLRAELARLTEELGGGIPRNSSP